MVTAALRSVFAQEDASEIASRWDGLANSLAERFPRAPELMLQAKEDVLAHSCGEVFVYRHLPQPHWKKVWSTNLLERLNEEVKRRTRVVGIFPNDASITRLVGAVLLEQDEHWQLESACSRPRAWSPSPRWRSCLHSPPCRKQRPEPRPQVIAP